MKHSLRKEIELLKKQYSQQELQSFSDQIFFFLEKLNQFKEAKYVLAYYSFKGEVATHNFIDKYATSKKILLPVVKENKLVIKEYEGKERMKKSNFGIMEPIGEDFTDYSKIDICIIPGIAFDRELNRMGRGKAFYDGLLPLINNAYFIGVCFFFQLKAKIFVEKHDFPMNCVISNKEMISL